jgi:ribonuclease BN (tRNA processing enzyme)
VYRQLKEYDKAKECYEKAIALDHSYAFPWNGLGNVYGDLKEYEKAKECYEKAIALDHSYASPWIGLGNVYGQLKEYDKARESYEKAIVLDPNNPGYSFNLGLTLFELGRFLKSKENLQKAQEGFSQEKNEYFLARVNDLLNTIKDLQNSKKHEVQEAAADGPLKQILIDTIEIKLAEEAAQNQQSFHQFLKEPVKSKGDPSEDYLLVLRRWNSYTPIVAKDFHISKGGGYFLKVNQQGIVIDPGFNFIDNFRAAGHFFYEIDTVLVSHAHNDHTADLESILTLLDRYNKEIKDSSDPAKEDTIRRNIAREKGAKEGEISDEEIDRVFHSSNRRKVIDFYLTASVFKKYSGWFDLYEKNYYRLHIVESGDHKELFSGVQVHFLKAKHDDIISDRDSVGFYIQYQDDLVLIYSGDTGWNEEIEEQYKKIGQLFSEKYRLLLAHLGGVKTEENFYLNKPKEEKAKVFYPNHLGRLGLGCLNEVLRPQVCIISEFGEELRERRQDLADIYLKAFDQKTAFIPGDIGLKFNLTIRQVWAIKKIDIKSGELHRNYIDPKLVSSVLLRKDFSLHFYNRKANFKKEDLVQFLRDDFDKRQR